jgi:hypothetical protein
VRMGVDATGSGSCPVAGFGISGVEPWGSATRVSLTLHVTTVDVTLFMTHSITALHSLLHVTGPLLPLPFLYAP